MHEELLSGTRRLISECECEHGCPGCVGPIGDTGPMAKTAALRILDLLIITKGADGTIDSFEVDDFDGLDELRRIETELADLLAADDVVDLAAAMEPGSVAGVLVWENRWAAPFASAARRAGGQLVANGRIPIQAIIASMQADEASISEGD